jgi:uncharacterized protein YciI
MLPALEPYTLVLLVKGDRAGEPADDDTLDELQDAHVAYVRSLVERGKIAVCGPLAAEPGADLKGVAVFRTTVDEARELARRDPAVQAGRLAFQAVTWWAEKGRILG